MELDDAQIRAFQEQGFHIARNVVERADLDELSEMVDRLFDGELRPEWAYNGKQPDAFYTFWEPSVKDRTDLPRRERVRLMSWMCYYHPYFWKFACHPGICGVASSIFGAGVKIFGDTAFMKPARHGVEAAMHQDTAFWPELDPKALNVWIAIDPATIENGCLHVTPGTHHHDIPHHEDPVQRWLLRDEDVDVSRQIPVELAPGDAIFFDSGLVHRSYLNRSDRSRRSMAPIYVSENVRHVEPWENEYRFKSIPQAKTMDVAISN